MAQTSGQFPALTDNTKKKVTAILKPRTEAVSGMMATRNILKGIRQSTLPKKPRGK